MYNALLNVAKKKGFNVEALQNQCFSFKLIKCYISLDNDGVYKGIDINQTTNKTLIPDIGSKKYNGYTNPLIETKEKLFGNQNSHNVYMKFTNTILDNNESLYPIKVFFDNYENDSNFNAKIQKDLDDFKIKNSDIISFKINNIEIENIKIWINWFINYRTGLYHNEGSIISAASGQMQSLLPKKAGPMIKNRYTGKGSYLASYGNKSFESYGLENNDNNIIGLEDSTIITYTIERLMESEQNYNDRFELLYWFDDENNENIIKSMLEGAEEDDEDIDEKQLIQEETNRRENIVSKLMKSIENGELPPKNNNETKYYMMNISVPRDGRLILTNKRVQTYKDLCKNIYQWFDDSKLITNINTQKVSFIKNPYSIFFTLMDKNMDKKFPSEKWVQVKKEFSSSLNELLDAIFFGKQIPYIIYLRALRKFNKQIINAKEIDGKKYKINTLCLQIIKTYLIREARERGEILFMEKLDENNKTVAYNCGRLFAIYEKMQEDAIPNIKTTIVDQFYTTASKYPARVFGRLSNLSMHHRKKVKFRNFYEKRIENVCNNIGDVFPEKFNVKEQGSFALGYYAERQDLFKSNKGKDEEKIMKKIINKGVNNYEYKK